MVDEKKKDSLDFFKYLDSNFFNDFKTLLDNINQIDQPGYNDSTILWDCIDKYWSDYPNNR